MVSVSSFRSPPSRSAQEVKNIARTFFDQGIEEVYVAWHEQAFYVGQKPADLFRDHPTIKPQNFKLTPANIDTFQFGSTTNG